MSKYANRIEVLARGVCVVGEELLYCRGRGSDVTYLPGGHVELEESATAALRREIDEELGVRALVGELLGVVEHTFVQKGRRHCEINLVFRFEAEQLDAGGAPRSRERKIEFGWIPLSELPGSNLEPAPLRTLLARWLTSGHDSAKWGSSY